MTGWGDYCDAGTLKTPEDIKAAAKKYTVFGRVTPEQKLALIKALKAQRHTVAMTGDGVNDANRTKGQQFDASELRQVSMLGQRLAAWIGIDPRPDSSIVYIEAKGETTPKVVEAIRSAFPTHSAPRLDVCEDYDEPGAFGALAGHC